MRAIAGTEPATTPAQILRSAFLPHPLLANPHLQTVAAALVRTSRLPLRVERHETADDDFIDIGWFNEDAPGPLVVLVHGIGGDLTAGYVHSMARALAAQGWGAVGLQLRGAGPEANRQPAMYHHGDTADFRWLCRMLRRRFPERPLCAIGWSLGGSIVIKALGEEGEASPLDGAIAVSVPLRLRECAEYLRRGSARFYQELMLRHVKRVLRRKHRRAPLPAHFDMDAILAARDFLELGDVYTAPMTGHRTGVEYCELANPGRYLHAIARPTLVLQALDDPFLGPATLPDQPVSAQVRIEAAEHGGHVGFIAADDWGRPVSWMESRLLDFLKGSVAVPAEPRKGVRAAA